MAKEEGGGRWGIGYSTNTARKQSYPTIIYFTDIVTIVSASQSEGCIYGKRSPPHLGYGHTPADSMCLVRIGRDVTSIVAACRCSVRSMCSMNSSS